MIEVRSNGRYVIWAIGLLLLVRLASFPAVLAQAPSSQDPRLQLAEIDQLYYDEKFEEAAKAYEAFLEKYPDAENREQAMLRLGQTYAKLARDAEARNMYRQLIAADPDGNYAISAVQLMANLYVQRYQHAQAIRACREIAAKYPNTRAASIAGYLIPTYLYSQGKVAEAIEAYQQFIEEYPNSIYRSSAFNSLVALYLMQNDFAKAEALILNHLTGRPEDADLLENLADVYRKQGKLEEALKLYKQALTSNPDNTSILEKIGEIYAEQGDQERAIIEWQRIIQKNPRQYYQHQRLGDIYKEHRLYDQAIKEYEAAIQLQPRIAYVYTQLADVYRIQNVPEKAIETYVRALVTLGPNYGGRDSIYADLAELYPPSQREKAFLEAEAQVRRLLQSGSPSVSSRSQQVNLQLALAELAFHRGAYEEALAAFRELAQIYPDQGQALQKAAQTLERNREMLAAARFYEEILRLFPRGGLAIQAQLKASQTYAEEGQWNHALSVLQMGAQTDVRAQLLRADILLHRVHDIRGALAIYRQIERSGRAGRHLYEARLGEAEALILLGEDADSLLESLLKGPSRIAQRAQLLLGHAHFFRGEFELATQAYQKVSQYDLHSEWINDALEYVALIRGNGDFFYQPLTLYARGLRAELSGDVETALTFYDQILKTFPKARIVSRTQLKIADLYLSQGKQSDAIAMYHQVASEQGVLAAEALFKLASLYVGQDDAQAQQIYSQLIEQYPKSIYAPEARRRLRVLLSPEGRSGS